METFAQVIEKLGGAAAFAVAIGIPYSHARTMKARSSIPSDRWEKVVEAARVAGVDDINYELLARLAARKRVAA